MLEEFLYYKYFLIAVASVVVHICVTDKLVGYGWVVGIENCSGGCSTLPTPTTALPRAPRYGQPLEVG